MAKANLFGDQQQKQLGLWFGSAEGPEKTTTGECEDSGIVEVNKRKRREEKKPSLDTAPIDDGDGIRLIKKSKRDDIKSAEFSDDIKSSDLGSSLKGEKSSELGSSLNRESEPNESLESGKYSDLGSEFEEVLKQVEGKYLDSGTTEKKKRKRDEIEAEYKERRSGAMGMNEGGGGGGGGLRGRVVGEKRKHVDDPVDMMMVSKDDGFDDEAILLRTVFVGNLPLKVKKKVLVMEFSQFGEIESIRIRSFPLLDVSGF